MSLRDSARMVMDTIFRRKKRLPWTTRRYLNGTAKKVENPQRKTFIEVASFTFLIVVAWATIAAAVVSFTHFPQDEDGPKMEKSLKIK